MPSKRKFVGLVREKRSFASDWREKRGVNEGLRERSKKSPVGMVEGKGWSLERFINWRGILIWNTTRDPEDKASCPHTGCKLHSRPLRPIYSLFLTFFNPPFFLLGFNRCYLSIFLSLRMWTFLCSLRLTWDVKGNGEAGRWGLYGRKWRGFLWLRLGRYS